MSFAGRSGKQDSKSCGHDNKADRPECACRLHEISPAPGAGEGEKSGGIPWWVLLIVGIVCLLGGAAAGIFVDKKYLR